jgi:hypothetical protein
MNLTLTEQDKLHLKGAGLAAVALVALLLIGRFVHPALSMAVCGLLFPWAIERYQVIRKEGEFSKRDIVLGAIPFEIIAAAWWLLF